MESRVKFRSPQTSPELHSKIVLEHSPKLLKSMGLILFKSQKSPEKSTSEVKESASTLFCHEEMAKKCVVDD